MPEPKRVVVTGMACISALGLDETSFWSRLAGGQTGIATLTSLDVTPFRTRAGAEIPSDALAEALRQHKIVNQDRTTQTALLTAAMTLEAAGLLPTNGTPPEPQPVAAIIGTGAGCIHSIAQAHMAYAEKGSRGPRPTTIPRCMANAISSGISIRFKLTGPSYMLISACAGGSAAMGTAFRMIRDGYADQVLCGGADTPFEPVTFASWNNLSIMPRDTPPETACRPFDRQRKGFLLGEGAGMLLFESLDSARRRKVRIRAEITGYGESSDAHHITSPTVEGQVRAMQLALECAGLGPRDLSFISAHGTATTASDACEYRSIEAVLGSHTPHVPVIAQKSYFGHLLGAAGPVETIAAILALEHGRLPPNLNLEQTDPECHLALTESRPAPLKAGAFMKNCFGFGGHNTVLIVRQMTDSTP